MLHESRPSRPWLIFDVRQKTMRRRSTVIYAAVISPPIAAALATQIYYSLQLYSHWVNIGPYVIFQVVALIVLCRSFSWRPWVKVLAAIPFLALSYALTVLICLVVSASNGEGL
jgi:hypothetical protein